MSNLREIRTRIASVKSTRQVTSAMKMVSASKLRKGQNAIEGFRYYSEHLKDILKELYKTTPITQNNEYTIKKEGNKALVLICSSNKGLCGPYNNHIIKKATSHINSLKEQNYEVFLYIIGKKANDFFVKREFEIVQFEHEIIEKITFDSAKQLADQFKNFFAEEEYVRIDAVYNKFKNAAVQEPVSEKILPIDVSIEQPTYSNEDDIENDYEHEKHILEPSAWEIINFIIPKIIDVEVYRILLDSYTSEHGARMTAMHQSTENANELINDLTIKYNKARQAAITKELVEIVSGAEALK